MNDINKIIESIALTLVTLEKDDIPSLGRLLNFFSELSKSAKDFNNALFLKVIDGLAQYTQKLIMNEVSDYALLEEGVTILQDIWRHIDNGQEYSIDIENFFNRFGIKEEKPSLNQNAENELKKQEQELAKTKVYTEEDIQIIQDFILEAGEHFEHIEVSLIGLEKNTYDKDVINSIFRSFHTIKGVSGFLNFNKIHKLAHSTENILDSVRKEEIELNLDVTDIVLESADMIKTIIRNIDDSLEKSLQILEGNIDVEPLLLKIENLKKVPFTRGGRLIGEILLEKGYISEKSLEKGLNLQKRDPHKKIGQILIDEDLIEPTAIFNAVSEQKKSGKIAELQVKVDINKLDNLVDLTGELVITQSMVKQNVLAQKINDQKLNQNMNELGRIVSVLQRLSMTLRMIPIKNTFQKMVRLVRDLSKNSGKDVNLEMFGEETEIDRNVVDELYEPLVHMIRNSIDHGIEPPSERKKVSKDLNGTIQLCAYHKGGKFIIDIKDDGRGINKNRIVEKALNLNLIKKDANLSESEIYNLIFHPGFSTAEKITDISGRGVGMDVVKRAIEKLRGNIEIASHEGKGTVFTISFPLTLAVIDGMVVRVGNEKYIIPTMATIESVKPKEDDCYSIENKGEMVMIRGGLLPLIRLDKLFGIDTDAKNPWEGIVVTVEHNKDQKAVLVDELICKEEIVIKSLGECFKNVKGLAGGAILGDGKVSLILDIAGLFEVATK
ncbi:MAG: chemotaxis protein CheA [Desulfobacterales bacterium]|nr:chemotaxis protein CheA [Desulfobacterales bacterium]